MGNGLGKMWGRLGSWEVTQINGRWGHLTQNIFVPVWKWLDYDPLVMLSAELGLFQLLYHGVGAFVKVEGRMFGTINFTGAPTSSRSPRWDLRRPKSVNLIGPMPARNLYSCLKVVYLGQDMHNVKDSHISEIDRFTGMKVYVESSSSLFLHLSKYDI